MPILLLYPLHHLAVQLPLYFPQLYSLSSVTEPFRSPGQPLRVAGITQPPRQQKAKH